MCMLAHIPNTYTRALAHTRVHHSSLPCNPWQEGGRILQELVGGETVSFYVSPFVRSRQTYQYLREGFHDEQVTSPFVRVCMCTCAHA